MKFYEISGSSRSEIEFEKLSERKLSIGMMNQTEFEEKRTALKIPEIVAADIMRNEKNRNTVNTYENFTYGIISVINPADVYGPRDATAYFIRKNLLLIIDIIDSSDSFATKLFNSATFKYSVKDITLEKVVFAFFESLIYGHKDCIEDFAEKETELEEMLINDKVSKDFSKTVFSMKKELLTFDTYYDQLMNIGYELSEDENNLYEQESLRYFRIFTNKVMRLHDRVNNITNSLVHLSDAYQASLDHSTNNTMKIFTVVTTIFLPLTLITGWYGMNFRFMPELHWKYAYYALMCVCVVIVAACLAVFRKKRFM